MMLASFWKQKRFFAGFGFTSSILFGFHSISDDYHPHIVIIGGGIMGSWSTYLLAQSIDNDENISINRHPYRVTLIDAGHPIRGSWGDNRALHGTLDCDLRLKMNKLNICDYLKLQTQSVADGSDACLIKKVGRLFVGTSEGVDNMYKNMQANDVPAEIINHTDQIRDTLRTRYPYLNGIQFTSKQTGLYTPFGYILKANNILEFLRNRTISVADNHSNIITVYENEKVISIDRERKSIAIQSVYDDTEITHIKYDKLLITAGPWTNNILGSITPEIPLIPMVISNEQTQNFGLRANAVDVRTGNDDDMPLVTFSDTGYMESGTDYWFIVPHCDDTLNEDKSSNDMDHSVKVGFHRQGDLMNTQEFPIPKYNKMNVFINKKLPHLRKEIYDVQHFGLNSYILDRAKEMVSKRLTNLDPENMVYFMRCLYQNTVDKEFIVGHPFGIDDEDIVIACGFNGGGFQMAPMISRFCLHLLLKDICPDLVEEASDINQYQLDFNIEKLDYYHLFERMKTQFNPSRETITDFVEMCQSENAHTFNADWGLIKAPNYPGIDTNSVLVSEPA